MKEAVFALRAELLHIGERVKGLMAQERGTDLTREAVGEVKANITLSYRHLEDARMRLGKVLQAHDGGASVYPR